MTHGAHILIVLGHPTAKSFGGGLLEAYEAGAREAGCQVDTMDLSTMSFNATPTGRPGPLDPELLQARERIQHAQHLVFVYPTWLGAMPARMKGFFEQVFGNGWGFRFEPGRLLPLPQLKGKSADVLVTMDTPPWLYNIGMGAPGHKMIKRAILGPSGVAPVSLRAFGPLTSSKESTRARWLSWTKRRGSAVGENLLRNTLNPPRS